MGDQDFSFFGIPIPMTDEMITHMDHEQMQKESLLNDIERLFIELDKDQLNTIKTLFHYMSEDTSARLASYYEGIAAQTLVLKHGVCGGCGQVHDEILASGEEAALIMEELDLVKKEDKGVVDETPAEKYARRLRAASTATDVDPNALTTKNRLDMVQYNLDDLRDTDTHELLGFICKNCGLRYRSIEDRMLRAPDACHGCYLKSAHG